jgi:hypothetical protein
LHSPHEDYSYGVDFKGRYGEKLMIVERQIGKTNKTVSCNVPPMLPGDTLNDCVELQVTAGIKPGFGDFSIAAFLPVIWQVTEV